MTFTASSVLRSGFPVPSASLLCSAPRPPCPRQTLPPPGLWVSRSGPLPRYLQGVFPGSSRSLLQCRTFRQPLGLGSNLRCSPQSPSRHLCPLRLRVPFVLITDRAPEIGSPAEKAQGPARSKHYLTMAELRQTVTATSPRNPRISSPSPRAGSASAPPRPAVAPPPPR